MLAITWEMRMKTVRALKVIRTWQVNTILRHCRDLKQYTRIIKTIMSVIV